MNFIARKIDGELYVSLDQVNKAIEEKIAEIAELKRKLMPCLNGDCILTCEVVEKYGKENAELKKKLEDVQASMYCDVVDANMEVRRLRRALWLARAKTAKAMKATDNLNNYLSIHKNSKWFGIYATRIDTWYYKWDDVERKCRVKAEEYK